MVTFCNKALLNEVRKAFPALQREWEGYPLIYFDNAATTLKPLSVIEAVSTFEKNLGATVHRGVYSLAQEATALYQEARSKVQRFIGAEAFEEIIFTRGTTSALNLLAESFAHAFCQPGDVILLTEIEHHSNLIPWQMVAKKYNLTLRFLPVNERGELLLEGAFDERVRLVSLAHISNSLGTCHPIQEIAERAHRVGAYLCVDGAQSIAHLPINVKQLDIDFFAFSGHKLYGPTGVGVLYGKKELLEQMSPVEGGGDMLETATLSGFTCAPLPYKFEAGTPMIAQVIGLGAAIDFITTLGMEEIKEHEKGLLSKAMELLATIERLRFVGTARERGAICSFVVEGVHPLDLMSFLDCRGVALRTGHHCSQPTMARFNLTSTCRLSFGVYNTEAEIEQFIDYLKEGLSNL